MRQSTRQVREKVLKRLPNSTFLLMLLLLQALYITVCLYYPWRYFLLAEFDGWTAMFASTVPEYLKGHEQVDILFIGSSLLAAPTSKLKIVQDSESWSQSHFYYMERDWVNKYHHPINIFNVAVPAMMASDMYLILKEGINMRRAPACVAFFIAPRDFIDNLENSDGTRISRLVDWTQKDLAFVPNNLSKEEIEHTFSTHKHCLLGILKTAKTSLTGMAKYVTQQPENYYTAVLNPAGTTSDTKKNAMQLWLTRMILLTKSENADKSDLSAENIPQQKLMDEELALYKRRYQPTNWKMYHSQLSCFVRSLELCRNHNIPAIVFSMPITDENRALIDKKLLTRLKLDLKSKCADAGVNFVELDTHKYGFLSSDFRDSVHLNLCGAKKWYRLLTSALCSNQPFLNTLGVKPALAHTFQEFSH